MLTEGPSSTVVLNAEEATPGVEKEPMLREIENQIQGRPYLFFNRIQNITVKDMEGLRRNLGKVSDRCFMAKNTLLARALDTVNAGEAKKLLGGPVFLVTAKGEPQAVSKVLANFAKEKENFRLTGGWIDGHLYSAPMIQELAKLPSRRELLAKVVGSINTPILGFVVVLGGPVRNLVVVMNQIAEKKGSH